MGWATHYIQKLQENEIVFFRPRGNSMEGKISSGQLVTVEPLKNHILQKGDIVLCKVKGNEYIHLIKAIDAERYKIGNNKGRINGWIRLNSIFGKCVKVEN